MNKLISNCLLVEDNPDIQGPIEMMLKAICGQVITASTYEEAWAYMSIVKFQVTFCDFNLDKGKDSVHLMEELKLTDRFPKDSINFSISGREENNAIMKNLYGFIPLGKPFSISQLVDLYEAAVKNK